MVGTNERRWRRVALAVAIVVAGAAAVAVPAFAAGDGAEHASATIRDAGGNVIGTADFTEDARGDVHVNIHVDGLVPGLHGAHIHAIGVCDGTGAFASAGGHHNPGGAVHGTNHTPVPGVTFPHEGDLPNLTVNKNGVGHLNARTGYTSLDSVLDADGAAIVVHAGVDDYTTNPTGNSGGRVACGVIEG
jgi:Cu-Zn family superoxide dismutase